MGRISAAGQDKKQFCTGERRSPVRIPPFRIFKILSRRLFPLSCLRTFDKSRPLC